MTTQSLSNWPNPSGISYIRLPQVELDQLAGHVVGALAGIRRSEQRPELGHPVPQDGDAVCPLDALGDHRRRHGRAVPEQLTDLVLEGIHQRAFGFSL